MSSTPQATVAAGEVSQELRAKIQVAQSPLTKETPVLQEEKEHQEEQLEKSKEEQKASLKKAVQQVKVLKDTPIKRTREERILDKVVVSLRQYKELPVGSLERIVTLQRVTEGAMRQPKKQLLDMILKFFKENKDNPSFSETAALQRIASLTPQSRMQVEIFYQLFMMLATKKASRKTVSLNQLRSIFNNEEFLNWVAVTMSK